MLQREILQKLNELDDIMNQHKRDTESFINAEDKENRLMNVIPIQEWAKIVDKRGHPLSNKELAQIIAEKQ